MATWLALSCRPPSRRWVGPDVPAPEEVAPLRRVSVQPAPDAIDTCLKWWTVDLFVDDGEIVAVTLDLWEP